MNGRNAEPQSAATGRMATGPIGFPPQAPSPEPRARESYQSEYDEPSSAVPEAPLLTS